MSATNLLETQILQLIFQNDNFANVGDATGLRGSTTAGVFYISLHTADPGEGGSQTTNEATYGGYARIPAARTSAVWDVVGNNVSNLIALSFAVCISGSNTVTHFGIGSDLSGAGNLFFKGPVNTPLPVTAGIAPEFPIGELDTNTD